MSRSGSDVPQGLKIWFIIHFWVDLAFALPLMIIPGPFLHAMGLPMVEPLTTRLVAAALIGIGGASFFSRNAGIESYRTLLNLKLLWSAAAIIGISWTLLERYVNVWFGWLILAIFIGFFGIWLYYRLNLPLPEPS